MVPEGYPCFKLSGLRDVSLAFRVLGCTRHPRHPEPNSINRPLTDVRTTLLEGFRVQALIMGFPLFAQPKLGRHVSRKEGQWPNHSLPVADPITGRTIYVSL